MPENDNSLLSAIPTEALVAELKRRSECIHISNESIKKCHIGSRVRVKEGMGRECSGKIGVIEDTNISWAGVRFGTRKRLIWYQKKHLDLVCDCGCYRQCPAQIIVVRE